MQQTTMTKEEDHDQGSKRKDEDTRRNETKSSSGKLAGSRCQSARREFLLGWMKLNPVNRTSELVPLNKDFDQLRKRLRSLIAAAKQDHAVNVQVRT
jgi:hypothetical protein